MIPLELYLAKSLHYVCQGDRYSANMPGNAALFEPIDLQSEHPTLNGATFNEHSIYFLHSKSLGLYMLNIESYT